MHIRNLTQLAKENTNFRKVIVNGKHTQIVIMDVKPGEDIGKEIHSENDQVLCLVSGKGRMYLNGDESDFNPGDCVLVPAGTEHNFTTVGDESMKIITTYAPPHHPEGTIHTTKSEAEAAEAEEHN